MTFGVSIGHAGQHIRTPTFGILHTIPVQAGATSDNDEYQRSLHPRWEQQATKVPQTQPLPNLRPFDDDVLNTQTPETALSRINSILERLEGLLNNTAIENVSQFAKNRNSLNSNHITKR